MDGLISKSNMADRLRRAEESMVATTKYTQNVLRPKVARYIGEARRHLHVMRELTERAGELQTYELAFAGVYVGLYIKAEDVATLVNSMRDG